MDTKVRIKIGDIEVEYEGPEDFLDKKLLDLINKLLKIAEQAPVTLYAKPQGTREAIVPLASFIEKKSVKNPQWKRFLATSEWLHLKDLKRIEVKDVTKALRDNNQIRIGNPSDCLGINISKGYCERDGSKFYVTQEGRKFLG